MELIKQDRHSKCGIYAQSVPVKPKAVADTAAAMVAWLDENNGKFEGAWKNGFAVAHAQVTDSPEPLQLFVVAKELLVPDDVDPKGQQTLKNTFFESRAIFNAEVLEAPEKVTRTVPERTVTRDKDKVTSNIEMVEKELSNVIRVPEGCMSFNEVWRKEKKVDRYHSVKVRYQYIAKGLLGGASVKTFEGWVEGLKAHIIQHETDHFKGKNIYYKSD